MNAITLHGITVHNLKNIDISIPYGKLTVITGVSGSGKSSLALDTLYAEGQRRFVESLSAYARQFMKRIERPNIDTVSGMLPAIAIESKNSVTNARSTVGTQTEINDYLRLLFARMGTTYCHQCGKVVIKDTPHTVAKKILSLPQSAEILILFPLILHDRTEKHITLCLTELNKQGFSRFFQGGQTYLFRDNKGHKKFIRNKKIEVLIDRLIIKKLTQKRLIESLETAFRYGKGHIEVIICPGKGGHKRFSFSNHFHCATCDIQYREPTPHMFSFNSPMGACPICQGFGRVICVDYDRVIPDQAKSLSEGAILPWTTKAARWEAEALRTYCKKKKIPTTIPFKALKEAHKKILLHGNEEFFGVDGFFQYLEKKKYKMHVRIFLSRYRAYVSCSECKGSRLKKEGLWVKVGGKNIFEITSMTIKEVYNFFEKKLSFRAGGEQMISTVRDEIRNRLRFLNNVGLGYLTLDRLSRTLSGGEAQRINLASALGTSLVDTLYVLDEPSVGLHARDNALLISILKELKKIGNTVVVIEHDKDMICHADTLIDLGPYAGLRGGNIVYQGTVAGLKKAKHSLTGAYLQGKKTIYMEKRYLSDTKKKEKKTEEQKRIVINDAQEHNLKHLSLVIPLGQFVVITGVSGSGKSTLMYDVLYNNFLRSRGRSVPSVGKVKSIKGLERIADMVLFDQSPIGRTPRSNPVTFINAFSPIRSLFTNTRIAKLRKMTARHFSFNVEGGRCPVCKGAGTLKVEMHFLADMYMQCETCGGTRYTETVREVRYKDKTITDVLDMSIEDAISFFDEAPGLVKKLSVLQDVGLGYLKLGQPAPTLSGGEAQRLKLASELIEGQRTNTLFLFDEPTVGLHYYDITYLMRALERLLEKGNSVVMIEHNLEVIKCADHIIDLGPEGGSHGGKVLFQGEPRKLLSVKESYTGKFLKEYF